MGLTGNSIAFSRKDRSVLKDVNFTATEGRLAGLVGANGSGKTSLLRILAGVSEDYTGSVRLGPDDMRTIPIASRARRLAYLPQARTLSWDLTVEDVVTLGRMPHGPGQARKTCDLVHGVMRELGIDGFADRPARALSAGEQARVLAARAIAQNTPVLIADEPTAGLDPVQELKLFSLLRKLALSGKAVVVASHNLSLAARYCDDLVLLRNGEVVAYGKPGDVLTSWGFEQAFDMRAEYAVVSGVPVVVPLSPRSHESRGAMLPEPV
ncbi:MAG: ABC transporter ATP-binding protein [Hyphomicrobiales bacterium]